MVAVGAMLMVGFGETRAGELAIKIGILGDQSGPLSDFGGPGSVVAARMAAKTFGDRILGKPIEIVVGDMQNKPDVAVAIARRWFDVEGVDVIADIPLTGVALAVQEIGRDRHKVLLINGSAADELTGRACSPFTIHWQDNSRALSVGTVQAVLAVGLRRWFFLTPNYAFGHLMQAAATQTIVQNGGTVVGSVVFPFGMSEFSSQLVTAAASNAQVFATSTVGSDTLNLLKQASEFHLVAAGAKIVVFQMFINEVHALGLPQAQGLLTTDGFYWDQSPGSRDWSREFMNLTGKMPSKVQAFVYLSVLHYLKSVEAANSDDAATVSKQMKAMAADNFGQTIRIRPNGRVMYDLGLYQVKTPEESKSAWDLYKLVRTIPAYVAFGGSDTDDCLLETPR